MILQALHALAMREGLVRDPDFPLIPVAWVVTVSDDGHILSITDTRTAEEGAGRGKSKMLARNFPIPRQPGRTSGDRAFFLCDKSEYALGIACGTNEGTPRLPEKLAARFALFRSQIKACADTTNDPGAWAVWNALESLAMEQQRIALPADCAANDLFTFIYQPDVDTLVHQRPAVEAYWRMQRQPDERAHQTRFACLVTGEPVTDVGNFPKVKYVPGGQSSGVALVSFNARAFESYGLDGNENAPISRTAAEACSTALQRLLHPAFPDPRPERYGQTMPPRHVRIGNDTIVCYWSNSPDADLLLDVLVALMDGDPAEVGEMYRSIWRGLPAPVSNTGAFYALTLTGAQGRLIVRDWFESSIGQVNTNLARHFADMTIVRNTPKPKDRNLPSHLPLHVLLSAIAPLGKRENIPSGLAGEFVRAALQGTAYPFSLLQRAIARTRAEIGKVDWPDLERRDARAVLIKAVLRRFPFNREVTPEMDPTNENPGYLCGRLMAIIERLQQLALGDVNANVIDRYFGAASSTPRSVFVRLLRNAHHHARKAQDDPAQEGKVIWLKKQIDVISSRFNPKENGFPAFLNLEHQGLFILGYHQQRHALWSKRSETQDGTDTETAVTVAAG